MERHNRAPWGAGTLSQARRIAGDRLASAITWDRHLIVQLAFTECSKTHNASSKGCELETAIFPRIEACQKETALLSPSKPPGGRGRLLFHGAHPLRMACEVLQSIFKLEQGGKVGMRYSLMFQIGTGLEARGLARSPRSGFGCRCAAPGCCCLAIRFSARTPNIVIIYDTRVTRPRFESALTCSEPAMRASQSLAASSRLTATESLSCNAFGWLAGAGLALTSKGT